MRKGTQNACCMWMGDEWPGWASTGKGSKELHGCEWFLKKALLINKVVFSDLYHTPIIEVICKHKVENEKTTKLYSFIYLWHKNFHIKIDCCQYLFKTFCIPLKAASSSSKSLFQSRNGDFTSMRITIGRKGTVPKENRKFKDLPFLFDINILDIFHLGKK